MSKNYFTASGSNLMIAGEAEAKAEVAISEFLKRAPDANNKLREAARAAFGSERGQGTLEHIKNGCNDGSPLDKLNKGTEVNAMFKGVTQDEFNGLKQNVKLFYDSDRLTKKEWIQDILNAKVGKVRAKGYNHNLFTFTAESRLFLGSDGLPKDSPTPFTALNFTYLKFNESSSGGAKVHFDTNNPKNYVKDNTKRMIALNMKAVAQNAIDQVLENSLPFILNPPGAFTYNLSSDQEKGLAQSIADSFIEAVAEVNVARISEVIVLKGGGIGKDGGFFTKSQLQEMERACQTKRLEMHGGVNADMVSIAENFHKKTGKPCPIPIMGEPLGGVGNGALSDRCNNAVDEFLYRAARGLHGITASHKHNSSYFNAGKAFVVPLSKASVLGSPPAPAPTPRDMTGLATGTSAIQNAMKVFKVASARKLLRDKMQVLGTETDSKKIKAMTEDQIKFDINTEATKEQKADLNKRRKAWSAENPTGCGTYNDIPFCYSKFTHQISKDGSSIIYDKDFDKREAVAIACIDYPDYRLTAILPADEALSAEYKARTLKTLELYNKLGVQHLLKASDGMGVFIGNINDSTRSSTEVERAKKAYIEGFFQAINEFYGKGNSVGLGEITLVDINNDNIQVFQEVLEKWKKEQPNIAQKVTIIAKHAEIQDEIIALRQDASDRKFGMTMAPNKNKEFLGGALNKGSVLEEQMAVMTDMAMVGNPNFNKAIETVVSLVDVPATAPVKPRGTLVLEGVKESKKIAEYLIKGQLKPEEEKAIKEYQKNNARPDVYIGFGFEYDLEVIEFLTEDGKSKKIFALKVINIGNPSRLPGDIKADNEVIKIGNNDSIHKIAMEAIGGIEATEADLSTITIERYNNLKNAVMNHVREMAAKEGDVNISRHGIGGSVAAKPLSEGKKSLVFVSGNDLSNISQIDDGGKVAAQEELAIAVGKLPSETKDALIGSYRSTTSPTP